MAIYTEEQLGRLVRSRSWCERARVAKQGYCLDVFVKDSSPEVRCIVADQGYGLDVLVKDKDWSVRCAVAEQGYGLERLVNDENAVVRRIAKMTLRSVMKDGRQGLRVDECLTAARARCAIADDGEKSKQVDGLELV